jgi:uncharacterized protein YbgA (DUF1722 family)
LNSEKIQNIVLSEESIVEYTLDRFENLKKMPSKNKLVLFHTHNKFLLMVHDQDRLRLLGNIVANHRKYSLVDCIREYEIHLKHTLSNPPTIKRHVNILMHIFGYFSRDFDQLQKDTLLNFVKLLIDGKMDLGSILWEIESLVHQYSKTYLASQTYFLLYAKKARAE